MKRCPLPFPDASGYFPREAGGPRSAGPGDGVEKARQHDPVADKPSRDDRLSVSKSSAHALPAG